MKNPKCPYCGDEQYLTIEDHRELGRMEYYLCIHCGSRSPVKKTIEKAYAAAMKRDGTKGYLVYTAGHHWEEDGTDYPDICVYVNGRCSECGRVLCRAGETTIHYPDELMYTDKDWDYRKELTEAEEKLLEAAAQRKVSIANFCPCCGADMREEVKDE